MGATTTPSPRGIRHQEVLHDDERCRVRRLWLGDADAPLIAKEPRGPDAAARARAENHALERLAGVAGVPRLATVTRPDAVMTVDERAEPVVGREVRDVIGFAADLATILAAVHRRGIIHRDICPANVLVSQAHLTPVLIDFDLATTSVEERPDFTHHREILGTLPYLSPEQTGRSGLAVDQRADLYSFGALVYELVTGAPPFGLGAGDELRLVHDILLRAPVPLSDRADVPANLSDIVNRLLDKDPSRRYQSAEGLAHDLRRLAQWPDQPFALGQSDFPARLPAPAHLVGRDDTIAELGQVFRAALAGEPHGLLVDGAPGVGKSALVNQLRPIVAAHNGWYVMGKADQYRAAAGAGALVEALRGVGRLLLAEPEAALVSTRERLVGSLGSSAGQVAAALPEFALLLGVAPEESDDPVEAQARLRQGVVDLLAAVVSPDHPLVAVVDDLQWADELTLDLVDAVLAGHVDGLLLVGTCREVGPEHPLAGWRARWRRSGAVGEPIRLRDLPPADLATMLAEMLRLPSMPATVLADALCGGAAGNPYDTVEQVNTLRRDELLTLGANGWRWDEAEVRRHVAGFDVADALRHRVARLDPSTVELLRMVDCFGGHVRMDRLAVAGRGTTPMRERLDPALDDGLVLLAAGDAGTGDALVRFRHDRVREAVAAGLDPAERARLRLRIARRLAGVPGHEVAAAEQYLAGGVDAGTSTPERRRIARIYRAAAARARRRGDTAAAERFLRAAVELAQAWDGPELGNLRIELHAASYGLGRLDEADAEFALIAAACPDPVVLAPAAAVQVSSLSQRERHRDAMALGLDVLRRLGYEPSAGGLDGLVAWASTLDIEADRHRPDLTEPRRLAAARLLSRILPSAFFLGDQATIAWIVLASQRMWARHGPNGPLAAILSCAGLVAMPALGDYRLGYRIGRHVLEVAESRAYEPHTSVLRHRFALHALPWAEPLEHGVEQARLARAGLLRGGDLQMAGHTALTVLAGQLECGTSLEEYQEEIEAALRFAADTGNAHIARAVLAHRELARALRDPEHRSTVDLSANPQANGLFHIGQTLAAAQLDDPDALLAHADAVRAGAAAAPGYAIALAHVALALAQAERVRRAGPDRWAEPLAELDGLRAWLADRAAEAPVNLAHLRRLLDAERAAAVGDFTTAARAYDDAITDAGHRPWHQAFATARAGRLYLDHGVGHTGRALLAEARRRYAAWGAWAVVRRLDHDHPDLRAETALTPPERPPAPPPPQSTGDGGGRPSGRVATGAVNVDAIDMLAILRASQALSVQTTVDGLNAAIAEQLTALTGATDVLLALRNEDSDAWFLAGAGEAVPIEEAGRRGRLPITAFRYAERTREPLLAADATTDDRFRRDPYVAGHQRCALLAVPIQQQGRLRAMLLLANRDRAGAFTADRLDAVMLIAGQLSVSLGNALLYGSLEERVAERTQELAAAKNSLEILSGTDSLTGLANRRRFAEVLDTEWQRAHRNRQPLGLAIVDIDRFKRYNDQFGHLAGDACLARVAACLRATAAGPQNLVARYGGEEFALILPGADRTAVAAGCERARAAVEALAIPLDGNRPPVVTISVGGTATVPTGADSADAVARADAALYEAKRSGRNRIQVQP